jgi:hypothetical protein
LTAAAKTSILPVESQLLFVFRVGGSRRRLSRLAPPPPLTLPRPTQSGLPLPRQFGEIDATREAVAPQGPVQHRAKPEQEGRTRLPQSVGWTTASTNNPRGS